MIVTRLDGGLGNQMFQYAAGLRLAVARKTELKLDLTPLGHSPNRDFALRAFRIRAVPAMPRDVLRLRRRRTPGDLWRKLRGQPARRHVVEAHFQFDPRVLELGDDIYLEGYWQSERYFADAADEVRHDLTLHHPPTGENRAIAEEIAGDVAPVSVHLRRGDYVTSPSASRIHGTCDPYYYHRALETIRRIATAGTVFVFSDDPTWAAENFRIDAPQRFVGHNGPETGWEDLRLMSLCHHHVIANSTFSWWGAWLCRRPDRVVVAPERWFRDSTDRDDDLIPGGWIRV